MAKLDKVENKESVVEKKVDKKSKKSSYSKKKKLKKIFLMGLLLFNRLLIIQLFQLQTLMEMLFLGHLLGKKVLKVLENLHLTQHK